MKTFFAVGVGVGVGIAMIVMWLVDPGHREPSRDPNDRSTESEPSSDAQGDASEIARLTDELTRERTERAALEEQVAVLESLLADAGRTDAVADASADPMAGTDEPGTPGVEPADRPADWFDGDALTRAGYAPDEIDWIRELWERALTARLELEDARLRKGETTGLHAIRDELGLEKMLRAEFGDEDYDAVRFAMNEQNRVIMTDLLERSAGFSSGIRPGDEVISYDGERIFRPRDLKLLIASGERDKPVEMRLLRNGEVVRVFLPRGPIGARLAFEVRPPIR